MTALRRLASVLGATLLIEEHDDVVAGAARVVARARQHLHHGRRVGAGEGPGAPARAAAPAPDARHPARRRRPHRRPPRPAGRRASDERGHANDPAFCHPEGPKDGRSAGSADPGRAHPDRGRPGARPGRRLPAGESRHGGSANAEPEAVHHILLPFTGTEISRRAVDAALRLARAEGATLMPAYLAAVPKHAAARLPDPEGGGAGDGDAGGDRTARRRERGAGRRADRARPHLPPRPRPAARRRAVRPRRRLRPAPPAPRASPATTSSGCWSGRPPR